MKMKRVRYAPQGGKSGEGTLAALKSAKGARYGGGG